MATKNLKNCKNSTNFIEIRQLYVFDIEVMNIIFMNIKSKLQNSEWCNMVTKNPDQKSY